VPDKTENRWIYTGAAGQRLVLWPVALFLFMPNRLHGPKIGKNTEKTAKIFEKAKKSIKCDVSKDKRVIFTKITCKPIFTRKRSQTYSFCRQDVIFCCHGTLKTEYPAAEGDTILP